MDQEDSVALCARSIFSHCELQIQLCGYIRCYRPGDKHLGYS